MAKILTNREELATVLSENKKVLVDFYADWCPPCRQLLPVIESVSEKVKDCSIVKINTDNSPEIREEFEVRSIPTLILFVDGKPSKQHIGFIPEDDLLEFIK